MEIDVFDVTFEIKGLPARQVLDAINLVLKEFKGTEAKVKPTPEKSQSLELKEKPVESIEGPFNDGTPPELQNEKWHCKRSEHPGYLVLLEKRTKLKRLFSRSDFELLVTFNPDLAPFSALFDPIEQPSESEDEL